MDIKTEREAFEAWYCRNHTGLKQSDLAKFRTLSGYSFSDSLKINISWEAWQAAKAQAVLDTYTAVVLALEDVQSKIAQASFRTMDADNENEVYAVDANELHEYIAELIEAQERQ